MVFINYNFIGKNDRLRFYLTIINKFKVNFNIILVIFLGSLFYCYMSIKKKKIPFS